MEKIILKRFKESSEVKTRFLKENLPKFLDVIKLISHTFEAGNKLFFFGNGGSAADAQHLAAEFVNRYIMDASKHEGATKRLRNAAYGK